MSFWTKEVEFSPAGAATWTNLGEIHTDADHSQSAEAEETSAGNELYGGTEDVYEVPFYDQSHYDTLRAIQLADDKVDLRFTDAEDVQEIEEGFSVIVTKPKTFQPRQRARAVARFRRSFL